MHPEQFSFGFFYGEVMDVAKNCILERPTKIIRVIIILALYYHTVFIS